MHNERSKRLLRVLYLIITSTLAALVLVYLYASVDAFLIRQKWAEKAFSAVHDYERDSAQSVYWNWHWEYDKFIKYFFAALMALVFFQFLMATASYIWTGKFKIPKFLYSSKE